MAFAQASWAVIPQNGRGLEAEYALTKELRSYTWEAVLLADCLWKTVDIREIYVQFLVAENHHEFSTSHALCLQQLLEEINLSKPVVGRMDLLNRFMEQQVIDGATELIRRRLQQCVVQCSNASLRRFLAPLLSVEASADNITMMDSDDPELASIGDERDDLACSGLEQLRSVCMHWFTPGPLSKIFKVQLSSSIKLYADLQSALEKGSRKTVAHAIAHSVISGQRGYGWLRDIVDTHLSCADIAQILYDHKINPNWIRLLPKQQLEPEETLFLAARDGNPMRPRPNSLQHVSRLVQQHCGVGGITTQWPDNEYYNTSAGLAVPGVDFAGSDVNITYLSHLGESNWSDIVQRLSTTLRNFASARRTVQTTDSCPSYLPILTCDDIGLGLEHPDKWATRSARVQRIYFDDIQVIQNLLTRYKASRPQTAGDREEWARATRKILPCLRHTDWSSANLRADQLLLHETALVAQLLCIALPSWAQAHLGPLRLFFLERPICRMTLKGINLLSQGYLEAELIDVACVKETFHERVLAFRTIGGSKQSISRQSYGLLAKPEDLIQLWGPGCLLHEQELVRAIRIGEKVIARVAGSENLCSVRDSVDPAQCTVFGRSQDILIAYNDKPSDSWFDSALPSLSSIVKSLSRGAEDPSGISEYNWLRPDSDPISNAGKTNNNTISYFRQRWNRIESRMLKTFHAQQDDASLLDFLQHRWGLQVNFCTSSARRVRIVDAIAELLPYFGAGVDDQTWKALSISHQSAQEILHRGLYDLSLWLDHINPDQRVFMFKVIRTILAHLHPTGIVNDEQILVAASPQKGIGCQQKLMIPQGWNALLADGPRTATFAYISTQCFEGESIEASMRCRSISPTFEPSLHTLYTQVTSTVPTTLHSALPNKQYTLEEGQTYFIRQSCHSPSLRKKGLAISNDDIWYMAKVSTTAEAAITEGEHYHFEEAANNNKKTMRLIIDRSTVPGARMHRIIASKDGLSRVLREATFDDEAEEIVNVIVN